MAISKAYLEVEDLTYTQKHLMCIMGLLLPPLPFFLMTGPRHTIRTKEFWVSVLLVIFLYLAAIVYAVWFIYIGFDEGRKNGFRRAEGDAEQSVGRFQEAEAAENADPATEPLMDGIDNSAEAEAGPSLPSYDESERAHPVSDKKEPLGDHKIQH